jgi:hypothetical protein
MNRSIASNTSAFRAQDHSEKLAEQRKPLAKLIIQDCVYLGLVRPGRARYLVRNMPGKNPKLAEEEVVVELRNNLYEQIHKFMRKYKGGPWDSPMQQEEIRLDINATPSVRSLVMLTGQLLREQNQWMAQNKGGFTARLFRMARK